MKEHIIGKLAQYAAGHDERATRPEAAMAVNYLDAFGYFGRELQGWTDISLGDIVNAVTTFQEFFGLKQTGQLDAKTVRAMESYRCGCPDIVAEDHPEGVEYMRIKRFADTNLPRWRKKGITYAVQAYVSGLGKPDQDEIIDLAFRQWMAVCDVQISRVKSGTPDIVIGTGQGQRSNFDGPGGTLAWAYLPQGDDRQLQMEFDLDETWLGLNQNGRGILMLNVACHEFGHLLGLDHSRVQSALMAPYYAANITKPQANDDIPRVVARYGAAKPGGDNPPPPPPPTGKRQVVITGDFALTIDGKAA